MTKRHEERDTQTRILNRFGSRPDMRLWRQQSGVAVPVQTLKKYVGKVLTDDMLRRMPRIKYGIPGCADLSGLLHDGRRIEIEVKSATGRQQPQQRRFQAMIETFGGVYILARSEGDVEEVLE
jgi:hypothetical protein